MLQKCETRAVWARASRNSCGGGFRDLHNSYTLQSQFPIAAHLVRLEMALLIVVPMPRSISS